MTPPFSEEGRRGAEWELLRALCSGTLTGPRRQEVLLLLAEYAFSDHIRQALFDVLNGIGGDRADILRQELPPRLARHGFPDIDFDTLFTPPSMTTEQALEKGQALVRSAERV